MYLIYYKTFFSRKHIKKIPTHLARYLSGESCELHGDICQIHTTISVAIDDKSFFCNLLLDTVWCLKFAICYQHINKQCGCLILLNTKETLHYIKQVAPSTPLIDMVMKIAECPSAVRFTR